MLARLARWVLAPLVLAVASTALLAPPSGAVTGPNMSRRFRASLRRSRRFLRRRWGVSPPLHRHPALRLLVFLHRWALRCRRRRQLTSRPSARIWFEQDSRRGLRPSNWYSCHFGIPGHRVGLRRPTSTTMDSPTLHPSLRRTTSASSFSTSGAVHDVYPDINSYWHSPPPVGGC